MPMSDVKRFPSKERSGSLTGLCRALLIRTVRPCPFSSCCICCTVLLTDFLSNIWFGSRLHDASLYTILMWGDTWGTQHLRICLGPGHNPGGPGWSPTSGSLMEPASPSACVCVSLISTYIKPLRHTHTHTHTHAPSLSVTRGNTMLILKGH